MRAPYAVAFLIYFIFPLLSASAQSLCTDNRYEAGGFVLSSTDICHTETVTITNTGAVEEPRYYYNYTGQSYEEARVLGGTTLDFSSVTKPGLYQVIQVGKKDGKETVACREVKVRNSTTAVFSYQFCTRPPGSNTPARIDVIIPADHPLNEQYDSYQIELNGTIYPVGRSTISYPFNVGNLPNSLKVTGVGGRKICTSAPLTTIVSPYNATGRDFDYYPEIKELKVLEDKSVQLSIQGQYLESYNLFRYEFGMPNVGLPVTKGGLKAGIPQVDTPPDPSRAYCYFIRPATPGNCGLFPLRSADICSVPLSEASVPTPATNYLGWRTGTLPSLRQANLQIITAGTASQAIQVTGSTSYQHDHGDCSQQNCYRIKVSYSGNNGGANFSGTSLSNQICIDHRVVLTDYPLDTYVTTEQMQNRVNFDPGSSSPYPIDHWEVFKHNGTEFILMETLPAGAANTQVSDPAPVTQSEQYKVKYVDECENHSALSPEVHSLFLNHDGNNYLHWLNGNPFTDSDIHHYEVIYYEGQNANRELGRQRVDPSRLAHSVNSASFTNMGSFRLRALSTDTRESFSNIITFAVKGSLFLPTAFTPNTDGSNDTFKPEGSLGGIRTFHMEIFSANGQKIADTTDPATGWDGRLPNGDKALFGNYLYRIQAEMTNGQTIDKNGSFILLY